MAEKIVQLNRTKSGAWQARKALPEDIRDQYGKLYGARWEAKFTAGRDITPAMARARFGTWLNEVENRITALRSNTGLDLDARNVRALAGEWYQWFLARCEGKPRNWQAEESRFIEEIERQDIDLSGDLSQHGAVDIEAYLFEHEDLRAVLRPIVAGLGQTSQFLADRGLSLAPKTTALFLDAVIFDYINALGILARQVKGDYSHDPRPSTFGKFTAGSSKPSLMVWELWEAWTKAVEPTQNTQKQWGSKFRALDKKFPDAAAITPDMAQEFIHQTIAKGSAKTALTAYKAIFRWAVEDKRLASNPFAGIKPPRLPKKTKLREKEFTADEIKTILTAASASSDPVLRWIPFLCAYSGARAGEISQLRAEDVLRVDGHWCLRLTPAAGNIKTRAARMVPLHQAIIEQGFLATVKGSSGRLFAADKSAPAIVDDVGRWVRKDLKITDPGLSPNHSWRHTFKAVGYRVGISERLLDAICGHKPVNVGRGYGAPTVSDMAKALEQFPRYQL